MLTITKKAAIALFFLIIINSLLRAQWVTIPDANFVTYLQQNFPTCMNGNLMDTTCSGIVNATYLFCSYQNIQNLDGIQYFDDLDTLACANNQLITLNKLPQNLRYLYCNSNQLTSLDSLPSLLTFVRCDANNLTYLNSLPTNLNTIWCGFNPIATLSNLPNSLQVLWCENTLISTFPILPASLIDFRCDSTLIPTLPLLPNNLQILSCTSNQLNSIDSLPSGLVRLYCGDNQLVSLPSLPISLEILECQHNLLNILPLLPTSLSILDCDYNNLSYLPNLPPFLIILWCNSNQISSLPLLPPYLSDFKCSGNQIFCFPPFPNSLSSNASIDISNNPFICIPNYTSGMDSTLLATPLCFDNDAINNPYACTGFKGVVGYTYSDNDGNCTLSITDNFVPHIPIELFDSTNTLINTFYTLTNGVYNYILDTATYTVEIDTTNKPYAVNCLYPGIDSTITLTTANPLAKNVNFDIGCKPGFDVGVKSINASGWIFPGLPHQLNFSAGDLSQWYNLHCASGVSGNVLLTVNGLVTFDSVPSGALTPTAIAGNTFSYAIADFGSLNLNSFALWFTTDTSAQAGDQVCVNVNVTPTVGDNDTTNNTYTYCYSVVNSYDPNDKVVYPTNVNPAYNGYFTYTINFQNTGNAAAQNIRVVDTLASNLDLNTFEIINYCHANTSTLTGNVATFRFPNIQLPDSTSNPEGSKGFIQYRIKPIANLPFGTQIENKAAIYFDFNAPITTNTAVSTFNSTVGVNNVTDRNYISVYPNPSNGVFNVSFNDSEATIKTMNVCNMMGKIISSLNTRNKSTLIDLSAKANGIYFLKVNNGKKVSVIRLIKQ